MYEYPDVWVCLFDTYGCDEQGLEEECANSSSLIEGLAPTAVFYPNDDDPTDYRRQEIAGNSALTDVSTVCIERCMDFDIYPIYNMYSTRNILSVCISLETFL